MSKEGITADLEGMQQVGIHAATIFNVSQGYPEGPVDFMSPQWLDTFKFAASEAERLGLELSFHNAAGWSSSGGPWITPEYSMQKVVVSVKQVPGGHSFRGVLSQPPTKLGYYRDIAVLAFPTPTDGARVDDLELQTLSDGGFPDGLQPDARQVPAGALVPLAQVVDLTDKMDPNGMLTWDVPAGDWTVLRLGHTSQGTQNHPAVRAGKGLECDKLSRRAFDVHWAGAIEPVLDKLGPLVGRSLTACLIDSYEVGCGNWTPGFRAEFQRRRGYDPLPYLPTLAGYYVESGEVSQRFLWDFRRTIGDLMADNYFGYFVELCRQHGLQCQTEPYGGPFEAMEVGANFRVPMGEFWVGGDTYMNTGKLAASIAHVQGTPYVGAEAFTAGGEHSRFLNHPATLKPIGDWAWTTGINRFIFHTYAHQPWMNVAPGMTFHMYGTIFSRLNTWWMPGRAWMSYLARSQFLLQQGRCAADVLIFSGEASPNAGLYRPELKSQGYDYDLIGTNGIYGLSVKDGRIRTPAGGEYRVLVLPNTTWMTPKLLRHVTRLVAEGATIIGPEPTRSPSLQGYPECDQEVARLAAKAWRGPDNHVIADRSLEQVLADTSLAPDFEVVPHSPDVLFIHRIAGDADIYFLSNQGSRGRELRCTFRVTGRIPELWDAVTGHIAPAAVWEDTGDRTHIPMKFDPYSSIFVVFRRPARYADPVVHAKFDVELPEVQALPDLKIISAEYGVFDTAGLADATARVRASIRNNKLAIRADNGLLPGDPAPGVVKELRVKYELDGRKTIAQVPENQMLVVSPGKSAGNLTVLRAAYGKFPSGKGLPPASHHIDVRQKIIASIAAHQLVIPIDDSLVGNLELNVGPSESRTLRIEYSVDGDLRKKFIPFGDKLKLMQPIPSPRLVIEEDGLSFVSPTPGRVTCTTASGKTMTAAIDHIPAPISVEGPWEVTFPSGLGAPARATFDKLISWSLHEDDGIRHFSGTAVYHKQFTAPENWIDPSNSMELDLGQVKVMAEVTLNGKNLGVLWQPPFRVPISDAVRAGSNDLEIRLTNLWPNRLIGDARHPDDVEWNGWIVKQWPDWLVHHSKRPTTDRIAFATWRHWNAESPLLISGLLGPVKVRIYGHARVE